MTGNASQAEQNTPFRACTISRDIMNYDLLIEDMESAFGESWGDLNFQDAVAYLNQTDTDTMDVVAIALDAEDTKNMPLVVTICSTAKAKNLSVILVAEDIKPAALHQLLQNGIDEFVPYPLPEGELNAALDRLRAAYASEAVAAPSPEPGPVPEEPTATATPEPAPAAPAPAPELAPAPTPSPIQPSLHSREGAVIAIHGLAGGVGASTLACNLAWELAQSKGSDAPKVALIDLDLQYGSVSTYMDLPRSEVIYELWSDVDAVDDDIFGQALMSYKDKLSVLTAPKEMLPLDFIGPQDVTNIIERARRHFDYVLIDMPSTLVHWSETILHMADIYFAMIQQDMRSAQNTLRLKHTLQSEDLPYDKLRFCLNRAPKFTDLTGKARTKRMAESLEIGIETLMPDGGKPVEESNDHGLPLSETHAKNPLAKEIKKLAKQILDHGKKHTKEAA